MQNINFTTRCRKLLADVYTPVGIYLRLRDRFRDTLLLESTDYHAAENSWSFICVNAIAGIEILNHHEIETKVPGSEPQKISIANQENVADKLWNYMQQFKPSAEVPEDASMQKAIRYAQGFYGYTAFDAIDLLEELKLEENSPLPVGLMRYRFYQYVIAIHHFKDQLYLCENQIEGQSSEMDVIEHLIRHKDVPSYPFALKGLQTSNMSDEDYREMVRKGIASCQRGDVFQIVLSRRFTQAFSGDDFNVYRALRSINPSPYLFYFDYGDYKLMGSSPESQLLIENGEAIVHPIAGTFKRSGDEAADRREAERLLENAKENAEHVMLVDLARNDLSRVCNEVVVSRYRQIQYFSHVIHLVSEVRGKVKPGAHPFHLLTKTFPAGTLSGAPKIKAMQLINQYEPLSRGFYGGAIGFVGLDGSFNHAILIRSFLSMNNQLISQAGAGVVISSNPESELQEVNNKLGALHKAVKTAGELFRITN
ncbi:MAG: anthranilate synthase component I family protein [Bacteroidetes bacterium]|nr:anthranilate synthase component I family protein [Bacteroidota bacterium]